MARRKCDTGTLRKSKRNINKMNERKREEGAKPLVSYKFILTYPEYLVYLNEKSNLNNKFILNKQIPLSFFLPSSAIDFSQCVEQQLQLRLDKRSANSHSNCCCNSVGQCEGW